MVAEASLVRGVQHQVLLPLPLRLPWLAHAGTRSEPLMLQSAACVSVHTFRRSGLRTQAGTQSSSTTAEELGASWSDCYFDRPIDDGAYGAMISDTTRTPAFAAALHRRLSNTSDQVVLDIGTGPACLLALLDLAAHGVVPVPVRVHGAVLIRIHLLVVPGVAGSLRNGRPLGQPRKLGMLGLVFEMFSSTAVFRRCGST